MRTLWAWYDQEGWAFQRIIRQMTPFCAAKGILVRPVKHDAWKEAYKRMRPGDAAMLFWWPEALRQPTLPEGVRSVVALFDHDSPEKTPGDFRLVFRAADIVTSCNAQMAAMIRERAGREPVRMDDGIDCDLFFPGDPDGHEDFVVGFVGRTENRLKRFTEISNAMFHLASTDPNYRLVTRGFKDRVAHEDMPDFYRGLDLLVCASACEGTPNPVMEACSCGIPVLSTPVGLVPEINEHGGKIRLLPPMATAVEIAAGIREAREAGSEELYREGLANRAAIVHHHPVDYTAIADAISALPMPQEIHHVEEKTTAQDHFDPFAPIVRRRPKDTTVEKPALRPGVTACVVTTGRPTLEECEQALAEQTFPIGLDYVRNVSPMNAAFQAMVDQCRTEYLIQVDDDMILDRDAAHRLVEAINEDPQAWMAVGWLTDAHLSLPIQGCKIYRTERIRQLGFRSTTSCEVDQNRRAEKAGWTMIELPEKSPVGIHEIGDNPREVFERYRLIALKGREHGYDWPRIVPRMMLERIESGRYQKRDVYALAGALVGGCEPIDTKRGEARFNANSPEFELVKELLE